MFVMAVRSRKPQEYARARVLHAEGMPFKQIAAALEVSSSSVFAWTHDIPLTPEQVARNLRGRDGPQNPEAQRRRAASWSRRCRERRAEFQQEGRDRARAGDPLHLADCMLYWAEGSKRRNAIGFVNSDPHMVRLFRYFLVRSLGVDRDRIRLTLNVYTTNGLSVAHIEKHWLALLAMPASSLRKHTLNHLPTSSSGRATKKLPYGVCRLSVHSTRAVQHIYGAIQEYGGFDEPAWLD
jgi:hypothetical protein